MSEIYLIAHNFLKPGERDLVSILKLAIVLCVLLHGVIGQMDLLVVRVRVIQAIVGARGANVAFLKEVALSVMVDEDPDSDVKLSVGYEAWVFDVFLDDEGVKLVDGFRFLRLLGGRGLRGFYFLFWGFFRASFWRAGGCFLLLGGADLYLGAFTVFLDQGLELVNCLENVDATASVKMSGFEDPKVMTCKVASWHGVFGVLTTLLVKIKSFEFCCLTLFFGFCALFVRVNEEQSL